MDFYWILFILLGTFGTTEIVVIVILALLLFGGKKIPELMKGLGTGLKEFKKASESDEDSHSQHKSNNNSDTEK
ncbi:Sec-independent protein translocase subunit TatA/TatB [Blattabacterium cuenoti]|uniref:Sec-independent protein translocase subunit TatA/TatB n=1 Tax=Blattabacterium cuenoti TaxID=1653831 RepID=UPI00163B9209|nr:twin-arginine translocase TatA/TatE family subunit [Blattabacterium cuenoti]